MTDNIIALIQARTLYLETIQGYDVPHPHRLLCMNYLDMISDKFTDVLNNKIKWIKQQISRFDYDDMIVSYFNNVIDEACEIYGKSFAMDESVVDELETLMVDSLYKLYDINPNNQLELYKLSMDLPA